MAPNILKMPFGILKGFNILKGQNILNFATKNH
ncbi:hypothetical protein YPPY54_2232, partial [Yersinia pestis PY-54]